MQTSPSQTYSSLSLKDLLDARDAYHIALMKKSNVRATAVGLYLVRNDEVWPTRRDFHPKKVTTPRRLSNSSVTPFSWPCVLVFVNQWIYSHDFGKVYDPTEAIPRTLYLPDGRSVPVCVVEADFAQVEPQEPKRNAYPDYLIGGGFPLSVDVQGETRDASVGCLVTDGHTHYALTNRHVVGEPGSPVYAVLRGGRERIGKASELQISRMPFSEVYDVFRRHQHVLHARRRLSGGRRRLRLDVAALRLGERRARRRHQRIHALVAAGRSARTMLWRGQRQTPRTHQSALLSLQVHRRIRLRLRFSHCAGRRPVDAPG